MSRSAFSRRSFLQATALAGVAATAVGAQPGQGGGSVQNIPDYSNGHWDRKA